jgi:hypothetical protein
MADTDLAIEGKDVQITITLDGAIKRIADMVTGFSANPVYDRKEYKLLGTTDTTIDDLLVGWDGTINLAVARKTIDEMMDLIHAAERARGASVVNIREQVNYRDGSRKTYVYRNCKLQIQRSFKRGETSSFTLNWKSGTDRQVA